MTKESMLDDVVEAEYQTVSTKEIGLTLLGTALVLGGAYLLRQGKPFWGEHVRVEQNYRTNAEGVFGEYRLYYKKNKRV